MFLFTSKVIMQNGHTAQCSIIVKTSITHLSIYPSHGELFINETLQLIPTMKPTIATEKIYYSSSNNSVATVSSNGIITAVGIGTTTIYITNSTGSISTSYTLKVKKVVTLSDTWYTNGSVTAGWHTIGSEKIIDNNIGRKITKIEGSMYVVVYNMWIDKYFGLAIDGYNGNSWGTLWSTSSGTYTWNFCQNRGFTQDNIIQNITTNKLYTKIRGRYYFSDRADSGSGKGANFDIKVYFE